MHFRFGICLLKIGALLKELWIQIRYKSLKLISTDPDLRKMALVQGKVSILLLLLSMTIEQGELY